MAQHEIGQVIAGDPKEARVNKFKEFLSRPENLATALVLTAALTSQRRQGQSKGNKFLEASVGALGFRGGLQKGVQEQRSSLAKEEQDTAKQAADIALGKRQVATAERRNQLLNTQITTPPPQNETTSELEAAQAELARAKAAGVGAVEPVPNDYASLFALNKKLFIENNPGVPVDIMAIDRQTTREVILNKVREENRVNPDGSLDLTDAESAALGITVAEPVVPGIAAQLFKPASRRNLGASFTSLLLGEETERKVVVQRMKAVAGFEDLSDEEILDKTEEARNLASSKKDLRSMTVESMQELLDTFSRVMSPSERQNIRKEIQLRTETPTQRAQRLIATRPGGSKVF